MPSGEAVTSSEFRYAAAFWSQIPRPAGLRRRAEIERELAGRFSLAVERWPRLRVDPERFAAHWGRQLGKAPSVEDELEHLHLEDLYLAFACAQGEPQALSALQTQLLPLVVPAIRGVDAAPAFVDEVKQQILERLLVSGPGSAPRIAEYAGRGTLESWLRAVALRLALNVRRAKKRAPEVAAGEALLDVAGPVADPQLGLLRARYGPEFSAALRRALSELTRQERNVLKLHFVDGLSLNQIGGVYQTHKSTVSRWIGKAREALLARTRADLESRLGLAAGELESLMRAIGSELELRLSKVLESGKA